MFYPEDHTYDEIRRKSLIQWLEQMESHEDIAVRGGVTLAKEYLKFLEDENTKLKSENELKNQYLKKMAAKKYHS